MTMPAATKLPVFVERTGGFFDELLFFIDKLPFFIDK